MAADDHAEEIERLLRRAEKDPRTHTFARLADLYRKSGELERALEVVEGGLRHHPHYLNARLVHARVLRELGRPRAARTAFRRVLEIDSENLVAQAALDELGSPTVVRSGEPVPQVDQTRGPASNRWLARLDADWHGERVQNGTESGLAFGPSPGPTSKPEPTGPSVEDAGSPEPGPEPGVVDESVDAPVAAAEPATAAGSEITEPPPTAAAPPPPETSTTSAPVQAPEVAEDETAATPPDTRPNAEDSVELETATLAALYVRQGLFDRAIGVYERLLARDPYNARLAGALDEARRKSRSVDRPRARSSPAAGDASPAPAEESTPLPAVEPDRSNRSARADRIEAIDRSPGEHEPAPGTLAPGTLAPVNDRGAKSIRSELGRILDGESEGDPGSATRDWTAWLDRLDRGRS